ncbi:MAG: EAL domain-containing protein [Thiobacillaceae bacterium]|nr:EAL domain-containing protein [Thiobacillaceae bacterium]
MMRSLGIRARVVLLAMLPIAVISVALTWYFTASRLQDIERALQEQGQAMARQLAQASEYGLFIGEQGLLEDLAHALRREEGVLGVRIRDREGRTRVQIGPGMDQAAPYTGIVRTADVLYITETIRSRPLAFATAELGESGRTVVLGQVTVGISLEPMRARQREIIVHSFLISAAVLVLAILVALRLGRDIVRPIGHLAQVVRRIGEGHLNVKPLHNLGGEFAELEQGITRMADELRGFYETLQSRIQEATARLRWQASHDPLTGLANRYEFSNQLEVALNSAIETGRRHTLVFMDLDQFKVINDTSGHMVGDELLRQLSAQLRRHLRSTDILARLGGDEFGVLYLDCGIEAGLRLAEGLRQVVEGFRFRHGERIYAVGVSMGLVEINADSRSAAELLSAADAACYAAKEGGRNRIHLYHEEDKELLRRRGEMEWAGRITQALDSGHLRLFCQYLLPLRAADDTRHYELLLRMVDGDTGTILPMAFLPAAERYKLSTLLDGWVLDQVIEHCAPLLEQCPQLVFSINISGASLGDRNFQDQLRARLAAHTHIARNLCLEITETAAIANLDSAIELIAELRKLGCRFALDDFGSGLSSFAYLRSLPVDYLKIDGAFVRDMARDPVDAAMVEAIHKVAALMGVRTVAEYVEDEATLQMLRDLGVDYAQGYHIHDPQPLSDLCVEAADVA